MIKVLLIEICRETAYSLCIVRPAVDLPVAKVAGRLALQQGQTDGTPQTGTVPRASINVKEVLIGDRFPAGHARPQLSLERNRNYEKVRTKLAIFKCKKKQDCCKFPMKED